MNRRTFLQSSLAAYAMVAYGRELFADDVSDSSVTIDPTRTGVPISRNFLGFSYETGLTPNPDFLNPSNTSLLALYSLLGRNGVIRIGGNSSESGIWRANGDSSPVLKKHIITPDVIQRVASFVKATGWQCIYGLNLGSGNPLDAADEAAVAAAAFGDSLIAFQIGNEPDLFHRNGIRPTTWTVTDYLAEWKTFADAVSAKVPDAQFAGPDTASSVAWVSAMGTEYGSRLAFLSNHYYSEGPGSSPNSTIDKMMRSSGRLDGILSKLDDLRAACGKPYRITEMNSVYGGGRIGVSDSQAAAVWAINSMLQVASHGGLGVNFHGGTGGAYSPVLETNGIAGPTSLFYALLMFSKIGTGQLMPVTLSPDIAEVSAYAIKGPGRNQSFVAVNSDVTSAKKLSFECGEKYRTSAVWHLSAPAFDQAGNTYFGGASIQGDNRWDAVTREGVIWNGTKFEITLPAASAALVKLS